MSDPSLQAFHDIATTAVSRFPKPFRDLATDVAVVVEDMPPDWILQEMEIDDSLDLTGLYDGIPLTEKSNFDQATQPDTVWLFRLPILQEWRDRGDVALPALVAHVTVHEFAHHFGWSDEDIAQIDPWWE